jgi:hypothetical protein|tara:strand:+ start:4755 stop:4976 length:222 start_codon:yes stop_codon:yes gene_type:complete
MKTCDTITYTRTITSREAQKIEFDLPKDMTILEYKRICKRMALALGYNNSAVEEHFGKDTVKGDPNQLKLLFD